MKRLMILVILMLSLPAYAITAQEFTNTKEPVNVSFVQFSESAQLSVINATKNSYALKLKHINRYITYFSDRPNRLFGQLSSETFLQKWQQGKDSFSKDAPNAMLSAVFYDNKHKNHFINLIIELQNPTYDSVKQVFTYTVKILDSNNDAAMLTSVSLDHVVLFIDNACLTCIG